MDRSLDPHLQRIIDNAAGMNNSNSQERGFDSSLGDQHTAPDWNSGAAPRQQPQDNASINDFGQFLPVHNSPSTNKLSILGRIPFDPPYHTHPGPLPGSSRLSLASRTIYNQHDQEPRMLSNADNHFRFAQNLREGRPTNPAPPRPDPMQQPGPTGVQRNPLFSQQRAISQSRDSIDQLANAMLMQNSMPMPSLQISPAPANFFHRRQPSAINQLQPQKQQVTPPFNLSKYSVVFLIKQKLTTQMALSTVHRPRCPLSILRLPPFTARALQRESPFAVLQIVWLLPPRSRPSKPNLIVHHILQILEERIIMQPDPHLKPLH